MVQNAAKNCCQVLLVISIDIVLVFCNQYNVKQNEMNEASSKEDSRRARLVRAKMILLWPAVCQLFERHVSGRSSGRRSDNEKHKSDREFSNVYLYC